MTVKATSVAMMPPIITQFFIIQISEIQYLLLFIQLKRSCVAKCPRKNDKKVDCFPNNQTSCSALLPVQTDT